jgi:zinc/manganese transport system ATP-binding protein
MDLMKLLRNWHAEQRTVICVLHDLELVAAEFPETLSLAREVLAWGPTAAALAPGASRLLVPTKRARETRGTAA